MKIHFGVDYYPEHWPKKALGDRCAAYERNGCTSGAYGRIFMV